ncbi:MAG: DUF4336 domain-containing protein [Sphingopyxis sp.]|uniref:DUF4336 domain-containing protein n=1 Tax=Sphingopyxis sp. TaxID=1908224 RepID=UPI002AB8429C|nr:DUF4336 domain-containing protein [Sphingopyxis sp.]MDZ3832321.1 DUF4336 domain-containing protein [Sphingopyxis sp.]
MTLVPIVPGLIWCASQAVTFGPIRVDTRMTIVRLSDGSLWVHSPIEPTNELVAAIRKVGTVSHVVAPNLSHSRYFRSFLHAFPEAMGHIARGLDRKHPELSGYNTLPLDGAPWSDTLESQFIDGLATLNETAWYHPASATLIVTDLLFCIGGKNVADRLLARLLGVHQRVAMSRTMKWLVTDRPAFARSIALLCARDIRRIILAHDQIIETDAAPRLAAAFAWIRDQ